MVPTAVVVLDKLPLTANGKVDRKQLPAPEAVASSRSYTAPSTPTEQVLAQIWSEVLKIKQIGANDNFFDLGGHSLLATQVISRIRRAVGVELPLRSLFESPTIFKLSARIEQFRRDQVGLQSLPLVRVPRDQAIPLSFAQQRLWILDQLEPNNPLYNIPRALRFIGKLDTEALRKSLNEIVRRHETLRTFITTKNREPVQHIVSDVVIEMTRIDLSMLDPSRRESEAHVLAEQEALKPFDLSTVPLLRSVLVRLDEHDHLLLLTMHHIVSDAWSANIFMEELSALYETYSSSLNSISPLPEPSFQYADYAAWQREWLQGDTLDKQLAFWRKQLQGAPALLALPTDRARPEKRSFDGGHLSSSLPSDLVSQVRELCRRESVTIFMLLFAVFQILLSRLSGQDQIVVGTDSANRDMVETEKLIGFFINLLPLHTDLSGNPTFRELLARVRETTFACYAHQAMPFDKIVEELRPERTLSYNPIVQVLFVMQNTPRAVREFGGIQVKGFPAQATKSKFDIAVFANERQDSIACEWIFSSDLFNGSTITRMAQGFECLLRSVVASPEARIAALSIHGEAEQLRQSERKQEKKQSTLKMLTSSAPQPIRLSKKIEE